jgi:glucokinase
MTPPDTDPHLLVADIGGSNSRFALAAFDDGSGRPSLTALRCYSNAGITDFDAQLIRYREECDRPLPSRACLAVAGPTDGRRASLTNGRWHFDAAALTRAHRFRELRLINDFQALAAGLDVLEEDGLHTVKAGAQVSTAPRCVLGPGTGLGVALVTGRGDALKVVATEGGHVDWAPVSAEEWVLRERVAQHVGEPVSAEQVLRGEGLRHIDAWLRGSDALRPLDAISAEALDAPDSAGHRAVQRYICLLARFAANTALSQGAAGGVFLGGGVLPRLLPAIDARAFSEAFVDKGPMRAWCEAVPVALITDPLAALRGAAMDWRQRARPARRPDRAPRRS